MEQVKSFRFLKGKYIHRVDDGGNHFINDRCVNPLDFEAGKIGSTVRVEEDDVILPNSDVVVTGHVPHRIDTDDKGRQVFVRL